MNQTSVIIPDRKHFVKSKKKKYNATGSTWERLNSWNNGEFGDDGPLLTSYLVTDDEGRQRVEVVDGGAA